MAIAGTEPAQNGHGHQQRKRLSLKLDSGAMLCSGPDGPVLLTPTQVFEAGRLQPADLARLQNHLRTLHSAVPSAGPLRSLSSLKRSAGEAEDEPLAKRARSGVYANGTDIERQASPTISAVDTDWRETCLGMVRAVLAQMKPELRYIFDRPVNLAVVRDYLKVIKHPMDLGTITQRLQEGYYDSPGEFAADMRLVWSNCARYNKPESHVGAMGIQNSTLFESQFARSGLAGAGGGRGKRGNAGVAAAKYEPPALAGRASSGAWHKSGDLAGPAYSSQRQPRGANRPMPRERMEEMAEILSKLQESDLMGAIQIIKAETGDNGDDDAEFELDFEKLSLPTLWRLSQYCDRVENKAAAGGSDSEYDGEEEDPEADPDI